MVEDPACCQSWENGEQMETQVLPKKQKDSGKHLHLALVETGPCAATGETGDRLLPEVGWR